MGLKLANSASGLLAAGVSDSATTLTLQAGHGSRFPTISSPDDFFPITVVRAQNPSQYELMRVTGRTGDTLTVQRMQEGTAALSFNPGDIVELRLTAGTLEENFPQVEGRNAKNLRFSIDSVGGKPELKFKSGGNEETVVRRSDLGTAATRDVTTSQTDTTPGRLMAVGAFGLGSMNAPLWPLTDLDAIPESVPSGMYRASGSHTNKPGDANGTVLWTRINAYYGFMEYQAAAGNGRKFLRFLNNNTWGSWREVYHTGNIDEHIQDVQRMVLRGIPFPFPGKTPPPGAIAYNGAELLRDDFPELWAWAQTYAVIVTDAEWHAGMWGLFSSGDGVSTFRVPDLRGEFVRGWDEGRGADPGRVFGSFQADELKAHNHQQRVAATGGANQGMRWLGDAGTANNRNDINSTANTGGTETRPRNIAYLMCAFY